MLLLFFLTVTDFTMFGLAVKKKNQQKDYISTAQHPNPQANDLSKLNMKYLGCIV